MGVKSEQVGGESMQVGDGRGGWRKEKKKKRMGHRYLGFGLGQRRWVWVERNGLG